MKLPFWLQISRPRFWIYLLGPFLIGTALIYRHTDIIPWDLWPWLLYFTYPANILIYGVNDIFDYETDVLNTKKQGYEGIVPPDRRKLIWALIVITHIPFLIMATMLPTNSMAALFGFWFLGIFYSMPPLRFKIRPFLDSASNILYAMPGIFAYTLSNKPTWRLGLVIAALLWCMAMHAYSAAPDIKADTQAGLKTIATTLGWKMTVLFCLAFYMASAVLLMPYQPLLAVIAGTA